MALIEDDLPGVGKGKLSFCYELKAIKDTASLNLMSLLTMILNSPVRSAFQVREDESLAHRLQEEECEQLADFNIQLHP